MNDIKLLPCPFCGGEPVIDREDIFCDNCHVSMRIDDRKCNGEAETFEEAREQAIEAWNTRKPIEDMVEKLEEAKEVVADWTDDDYYLGRESGFEDAIKIVRGGRE